MSRKTAVLYLVAASLLAFSASAQAAITAMLTSPDTSNVAGQNNTGAEYVERYGFVFPAAVTVVSGAPASGAGCGSNARVRHTCSPGISLGHVRHAVFRQGAPRRVAVPTPPRSATPKPTPSPSALVPASFRPSVC